MSIGEILHSPLQLFQMFPSWYRLKIIKFMQHPRKGKWLFVCLTFSPAPTIYPAAQKSEDVIQHKGVV